MSYSEKNIVRFIEDYIGVELFDYQKNIIETLYKKDKDTKSSFHLPRKDRLSCFYFMIYKYLSMKNHEKICIMQPNSTEIFTRDEFFNYILSYANKHFGVNLELIKNESI